MLDVFHLTPDRRDELRIKGIDLGGGLKDYPLCTSVALEIPMSAAAELDFSEPLRIGCFSHLNGGFIKNATIGRYCFFARDVQIGHGHHPSDWLSVSPLQYAPMYRKWLDLYGAKPMVAIQNFEWTSHTVIGSDVWLGNGVFIKDGVTIGHGAIIGARSVVTKDVAPYSIMIGNPARCLRMRFAPEIIERLLVVRWWRFAISDFGEIDFSNIERALDTIEALVETGSLQELAPETTNLQE